VTTVHDQRDWIFSDGDPAAPRRVGGTSVQAAFAYRSDDARGLRMLEVVEGTSYKSPDVQLAIAEPRYESEIVKVDYLHRTIWLRSSVPAALWVQREIQVAGVDAPSSYAVTSAREERGLVALTLAESSDVSSAEIVSVDSGQHRVIASLGPTGVDRDPRSTSMTATDSSMTHSWRVVRVTPATGGRVTYELAGTADLGSLVPGQTLRLWDIGPADRVSVSGWVQVRRVGNTNDYEVVANVPFTFSSRKLTRAVPMKELAADSGKLVITLH
jgi:hypothetical protein